MHKNNEYGRTMIEVLATLAILGMLISMVVAAINAMFDRIKLSRATSQIVELQKAINTRFAVEGDYKDLDVSKLISERIVPNDMITNDSQLHHSYKSAVTVSRADADGANGQDKAFTVIFEGVPFRVCVELLVINWQSSNHSDLISIEVDGIKYKWAKDRAVKTGGQFDLPMDLSRAGNICQTGKPNTIKWTFF